MVPWGGAGGGGAVAARPTAAERLHRAGQQLGIVPPGLAVKADSCRSTTADIGIFTASVSARRLLLLVLARSLSGRRQYFCRNLQKVRELATDDVSHSGADECEESYETRYKTPIPGVFNLYLKHVRS